MQKLCGCCELGVFKEQKKASGWKEEAVKRVGRAAGKEGSRGQASKTLQAIDECRIYYAQWNRKVFTENGT